MPIFRKNLCLMCGAAILVTGTTTAFGSHRYHAQGASLRTFEQLITMYYYDLGEYPITDDEGTWFEKLNAWYDHANLTQLRFGATTDARKPVDMFGHPLIYEPPSPATGNQIVLRSVGRNGIDEYGAGDDWDIRYGPNFGHWHTENWPAAYRRAAICLALVVLGVAAICWRVARSSWRTALIATWIGVLAAVVLPLGFDRGPWGSTSASIDPPWLTPVGMIGVLLLVLSVPIHIMAVASAIRQHVYERDFPDGRCDVCGYDLRGLQSSGIRRCPECGRSW